MEQWRCNIGRRKSQSSEESLSYCKYHMDTSGIEPNSPPKCSPSALDIQTSRCNLRRLSRLLFDLNPDIICQTPSDTPGKSCYVLWCRLCMNVLGQSHRCKLGLTFIIEITFIQFSGPDVLKFHKPPFLCKACCQKGNIFLIYFKILPSYCFIV